MKILTVLMVFLVIAWTFPVQAQELTLGITDEWELAARQQNYHRENGGVGISEFKKQSGMAEESRFKVGRFMMVLPYLLRDYQQTLDIKNQPGMTEVNPLLGKHPSDSVILGYAAVTIPLIYFIGMALPEPWGSSLFDTVRYTEKLVTEQNDLVSEKKVRTNGVIPFMVVFTTRF
ncbi:MAG: hypothetical protein AAB651_01000 [Patescibacteria group bacterium]